MANLLPEENKKILRRQYQFHLVASALFLLSATLIIGTVSLLPAYFFSRSQALVASLELGEAKSSNESLKVSESVAELHEANALLAALSQEEGVRLPTEVVDAILRSKSDSVTVSSIAVQGTPAQVVVSGKAASREALVAYTKALGSEEMVASVDLPVSHLAQDRNLDFSFKVILK